MTAPAARPLAVADTADLLALLQAERRPAGQPPVTGQMLAAALAGTSPIDRGWWEELSSYQVTVLPRPGGGLAGAVATGVSQAHNASYILWLAAGDDERVQDQLLDAATAQLAGARVQRAFWFATALGAGLEGLPVAHFPSLHRSLIARGFTGQDAWLYLRRDLADITACPQTSFSVTTGTDGMVAIRSVADYPDGSHISGGVVAPGLAIISWLQVPPSRRRRGMGRALLTAMLGHLRHLGAREVILYVDHDAPGGERDRSAAAALYRQAGFTEVDHLWSYQRS